MPAVRKSLPAELDDRLFTRADALGRGVTAGVLRGPSVQALAPGVYLDGDVEPTLALRLSALLTVLPDDSAVDCVTALRCWGVDVGDERPYRFVTTAAYQSTRAAVRVRRVRDLPDRRGSIVSPLPVLVATKAELGLLELVVAGDWLVHAKRATLDEVREASGSDWTQLPAGTAGRGTGPAGC